MHIARRWIGVYCFHLLILDKHDHEGGEFTSRMSPPINDLD